MACSEDQAGGRAEDGVTRTTRRRLQHIGTRGFVTGARLAVLALIVAGVYALVVLGIGDVPTTGQWTLIAFSALAAVVVALLYARVRPRVTARAEVLVRHSVGSPNEVARAFAQRVAGGLPVEELLAVLVESLRTGLAVTSAEVWAAEAGVLTLVAADPANVRAPVALQAAERDVLLRTGVVGRSWLQLWLPALLDGDEGEPLIFVPMIHAGEVIGLVLARREAGRPFARDDEETLAMIARQAALAFRNVRLDSALEESLGELRESRARVVVAADAERRRIERDLHDGAQQHLLGLAVNLKVARELARTDPARADALLAELSAEVHNALEGVRDLAHGIYPPLLAEQGLADAVRGALARSGARGRVIDDGVARYSQSVESTVYFCCVEGIQNAVKHAPSARIAVRLSPEDHVLVFEVCDDGPGFEPGSRADGAGLTNMRDRVGALGGTLQVETRRGRGTCVRGVLPLVSPAAR